MTIHNSKCRALTITRSRNSKSDIEIRPLVIVSAGRHEHRKLELESGRHFDYSSQYFLVSEERTYLKPIVPWQTTVVNTPGEGEELLNFLYLDRKLTFHSWWREFATVCCVSHLRHENLDERNNVWAIFMYCGNQAAVWEHNFSRAQPPFVLPRVFWTSINNISTKNTSAEKSLVYKSL